MLLWEKGVKHKMLILVYDFHRSTYWCCHALCSLYSVCMVHAQPVSCVVLSICVYRVLWSSMQCALDLTHENLVNATGYCRITARTTLTAIYVRRVSCVSWMHKIIRTKFIGIKMIIALRRWHKHQRSDIRSHIRVYLATKDCENVAINSSIRWHKAMWYEC